MPGRAPARGLGEVPIGAWDHGGAKPLGSASGSGCCVWCLAGAREAENGVRPLHGRAPGRDCEPMGRARRTQ